ncbi:MAG: sigma-70 family RNA polymerase sigma factor [Duncaniella sp.]|nr:sigma-70 family RNA polymerase sigma factor [Duncaniella sp.]
MDKTSLVELCKNGDRDALGILYSRYSGRMMRIIRHYIHDPEVASDILHDGFIVAFTQINKLRNCDKLEFWLGTIMKNLSIQYLNQEELTTLLNDDVDVPEIPEIHTLISYEELEAIINMLPDGYRKVFKLAVLDNMSHAEIGKLLGIAPHSSSSQLFRAKELLRKIIREHGIELSGAIGIILLLAGLLPRLITTDIQSGMSEIASGTPKTATSVDDIRNSLHDNELAADILPGENVVNDHQHTYAKATVNTPLEPDFIPEIAENTETAGSSELSLRAEQPTESDERTTGTESSERTEETESAENHDRTYEPATSNYDAQTHHFIARHATHKHGLNVSVNTTLNSQSTGSSSGFSDNLASSGPWADGPATPSPGIPSDIADSYVDTRHHPTISVSLSANYMLTRTLGIETGVTYSHLRSEASKSGNRYNFRYHYIGIPIKLNLNIYSTPALRIYGSVGGGLDIPVSATKSDLFDTEQISTPIQWSLSSGIGVQFNITQRVGLYAEPSMRYNFHNNDTETVNKWQEERFQFTLPIGLRLNF